MAMTAASAATMRLAAAHVALQQAVHRMRRRHVVARSRSSTRFCAPVGLNGSIALICSRTRSFSSKAMPGHGARLAALQRHAAFQPEELLEDQAELRRRAEGVEQPQVAVRRRESGCRAARVQRSGILQAVAQELRAARRPPARSTARMRCISVRRSRVVSLPGGLVDRHDAADVQRRPRPRRRRRRGSRTPGAAS